MTNPAILAILFAGAHAQAMALATNRILTPTRRAELPHGAHNMVPPTAFEDVNEKFDLQIKNWTGMALSRRSCLSSPLVSCAGLLAFPSVGHAGTKVTGPNDGNLGDLPPDAVKTYLQYRYPLQTSADFYMFELQRLLKDTSDWGEVGELFQAASNRGQGNPSRIEREFTNVMRVLGLAMPPDVAEDLMTAQFKFDRAMAKISKATGGIRRDLPVEIDKSQLTAAAEGWDEGRIALNSFFGIINDTTGLNELKTLPAAGPTQFKEYGRSESQFLNLKKKIKLCQNRGGPTLSAAWGQLMVSGYLQDSCGIPDLDAYFYQ